MGLPEIPRSRWAAHPHFPTQTLLLSSHDSFLRTTRAFLETVEHLASADARKRQRWLGRLADDFAFWLTGMRGHERYEETRLYPALTRRWNTTFEHLRCQHRQLDAHKLRVTRALAAADTGRASEVAAALAGFQSVLARHLAHEEDRVIPLLLELSPEEFAHLAAPAVRGPLDGTDR